MDEQNEFENSQESHEELDLDLEETQEEASPEAQDDVEALKQRLADVEAKNKQLYARLKKPTAEKPKLQSSSIDGIDEIKSTVSQLAMKDKMLDFGLEYGLSREEVQAVFRINPNPSKETLEDPFVKGGLQAIRAKKSLENAIPSSSKRSPTVDGKTWTEMSKEERAKNYSTVMKKSVGR